MFPVGKSLFLNVLLPSTKKRLFDFFFSISWKFSALHCLGTTTGLILNQVYKLNQLKILPFPLWQCDWQCCYFHSLFSLRSMAILMIAQKPNCNHSMHCACAERKILLPISVLENFCELLCEFCLKLQLDSFICEASQLSRIFLPTYLDSQTVSLEHESQSLRKSSHTLRKKPTHMHRCKTKNRGSYPTNTG